MTNLAEMVHVDNKIFLITDFVAIADVKELQTKNIQKTIDECFKNGG